MSDRNGQKCKIYLDFNIEKTGKNNEEEKNSKNTQWIVEIINYLNNNSLGRFEQERRKNVHANKLNKRTQQRLRELKKNHLGIL